MRYFLRVIFEVTYVGLVDYDFVTLLINYSHLILEYVFCVISNTVRDISSKVFEVSGKGGSAVLDVGVMLSSASLKLRELEITSFIQLFVNSLLVVPKT